MNDTDQLVKEYYEWLEKQTFVEKDLDYSALEKYKPMLKNLSLLGNNGIYVFDLYKKENIFTLYNFSSLYGYDQSEAERTSSEFLNTKIHPEDFQALIGNAASFLKFLLPLSKDERSQYKLINEYRIANPTGQYSRVVEQYQVLEFDKHGNMWLALGVIDLLPEQQEAGVVKSQILEYKTGKFLPLTENANSLVKENFSGTDQASRLSDNVHKVNLQRKKIIEKLHAENAADVSRRILKYGLLE